MTSAPASWTSQSNWTPVASRTRRVASESSGPTPSPGMNVTRWAMVGAPSLGCPKRISPRQAGNETPTIGAVIPSSRRPEAPEMANGSGKGLEGVVAARTSISDIDGQQGKLFYAGYDIADLAANATFEETIYLLHHLELPTSGQLEETVATLRAQSTLDGFLVDLIGSLVDRTGPMTALRTVVSAAAAVDPDDDDSQANLRKAYRLMAKTP